MKPEEQDPFERYALEPPTTGKPVDRGTTPTDERTKIEKFEEAEKKQYEKLYGKGKPYRVFIRGIIAKDEGLEKRQE